MLRWGESGGQFGLVLPLPTMAPVPLRSRLVIVFLLLLVPSIQAAPENWAAEIDRLVANDAARPPAPGGVVFIGSSSIRLWSSLAQDFPGVATINRGFGGSELPDSVHYIDRVVIPYRPRAVVLYAGENDLWAGKSSASVVAAFEAFRSRLHAALPEARLIFLSIKESPSRVRVRDTVRETNRRIAELCAADPRCVFVDVATPLLDAAGGFRPELFIADQLHLSAAGYAIWKQVLAPHLSP